MKVFLVTQIKNFYKDGVEYSLLARLIVNFEQELQVIFNKSKNKFLVSECLDVEKKYLDLLVMGFQSVIKGEFLEGYEDLLVSPDLSYSSLLH